MRSAQGRRRFAVMTLVFGIVGLLFGAVPVGADTTDADIDLGDDYVIVELQSPAAVAYEGGIRGLDRTRPANGRFDPDSRAYQAYQKHLENEHASFRSGLDTRVPGAVIVREYYVTANAVAVKLNGADQATISRLKGVKSVKPSGLYSLDMNESNALVGSTEMWRRLGGQATAGAGVKVGIIDSGIYDPSQYDSAYDPAEQQDSFFACKHVALAGVYYSGVTGAPANGIAAAPLPAPAVLFVFDHGTHVAGTVGGCVTEIESGPFAGKTLSGVAPGVELHDYNVFPGIGAGFVAFGGSAFSHDIAAAIEDSVLDGMHVINMSLGGGVQGPHDFLAEVSNAAMDAGVVVVTSAGNEGPGNYTVGSPGSAENVISVAASTNTRGLGADVIMPDGTKYEAFYGDFGEFDGTPLPLIDWPGADNEACTSNLDGSAADGQIVLIARGTCTFTTKITNAANAGAAGVIVYSDDREPGGMAGDGDLPAVMVSNAAGLDLEAAIAADTDGVVEGVVVTGIEIVEREPNLVAGFSSRGPAPFTSAVKPDIMAPGVDILSSVFSGYELFSGTSMASPHVAGAAALLLANNPDLTQYEVKSALVTSASDHGFEVWEQGSGLLNIPAADAVNAYFQPTVASFGGWTGNRPVNTAVDISIDSSATCTVIGVTGPSFTEAEVNSSGDTLTVEFNGGREAPSGLHQGVVSVDCDGQTHRITWGIAINR